MISRLFFEKGSMDPPERKKHKTEEASKPQSEIFRAVLKELCDYDESRLKMFLAPVKDEDVPGYSTVIDEPMDLGTMKEKVESRSYANGEEFCDDIELMCGNALHFNEKGSIWHTHAKKVKKLAERTLIKHGLSKVVEGDRRFVATAAADYSIGTFEKDERKANEDVNTTLEAMETDLQMSVEELRAKYARGKEADEPEAPESSWTSDESSEESSSSENDSESSCNSSDDGEGGDGDEERYEN